MALAAAVLPAMLAYNISPSPTFLNQALAFALWAGFVAVSALARPQREPWALYAALGLLVLAAAWSWGPGELPASLALSGIATLAAAAVMVAGGASGRTRSVAPQLFGAFCWGWVVAGVLNVTLAVAQVFLPDMGDGNWIAASG
jgi:hypothetical protein